ncbi:unnamed protein product [Ambrosiozyma monospora]|uniref:Unnamed protein product n=1 Tax=Ambrosiozyma monospora TaxID=43982 RepID=A0ACB5TAK6_AMBMO|nr:unnamed protein product [Ambrosiozyma monospora]
MSDTECDYDFPISCLPPTCHTLELRGFTTFSRQFPETLHTLEIHLNGYSKSFEYFWDRFITPLDNLYVLKIYVAMTTHTIDFSYLEFLRHLHTLKLFKEFSGCKFIFNELPPSMLYVSLSCPDLPSTTKNAVVLRSVGNKTLESMNHIFDLDFRFESESDSDHDNDFDSNFDSNSESDSDSDSDSDYAYIYN